MDKYLLSIYQPAGEPPPAETLEPIMHALDAVNAEIRAAGAWVFGAGLFPPSSAAVVRVTSDPSGSETEEFASGPYLSGDDHHVGGFTIIQAPGMQAALEWGRKVARATTLPIEVRPLRFGSAD
ncbi:hypothetical protein J4H86_18295 [Spiractinospora alimapuensis]|uniref:YciI family protein n=1 Tax=Spiractinospora alimapuensis TaxID=2820884 RepID=UPI001F20A39C|nr:hypothetical protein [Spiractinospora alimapuensis]QVQ50807.1 hypothetical protein J4H86_18295 [Spiractinospora alimapuensis]